MLRYLLMRFLTMIATLFVISALVFVIITLPPGDYLSNQIAELRATGQAAGVAKAEFLRREYALDRSLVEQYFIWIGLAPNPQGVFSGMLQGDLGWSFEHNRPVVDLVGDAIWLTVLVNLAAVLFIYATALPLGAVAAAHAGRPIDYIVSFIGYIGLATPNFLLALILYYYGERYFGLPIGGLMRPEFENAPLSWAKVQDIAAHLIVPTVVIGTAGMAAMAQRLRANLLDELGKPYVTTAKAKGASPTRALVKYPLRVALNPFVADIGNLLPTLISGSVIVSVVMSLPTLGPRLLEALQSQDMFLSGFILLFVAALTQVGMLLSDIALAILDPRIRTAARGR